MGYSSYILGVSIKLLMQIDCSLSYSENQNLFYIHIHIKKQADLSQKQLESSRVVYYMFVNKAYFFVGRDEIV